MRTFESHLKKELKNKKFAEAYETEKKLLGIAIKIAEERNKKGLSQTELARKANITQQQLSKIERGQNYNMLTFLKISHALNLNLEVNSYK